MKIKKDSDPIFTSDELNEILYGEHEPSDFLVDEDEAEQVRDAIDLVSKYIDFLSDNNKLFLFEFTPESGEKN